MWATKQEASAGDACFMLCCIVEAKPDLAGRVANEPGALAALVWAAKSEGSAQEACGALLEIAKGGGNAQSAAVNALLAVAAGADAAPEAAAAARGVLRQPPLNFSEAALEAGAHLAARAAELEALPVDTRAAIVELAAAVRGGGARGSA